MPTIPLAGLRTELLLPAYDADRQARRDGTLADRLNAPTDTRNRLVPLAELYRYLDSELSGTRSLWVAIKEQQSAAGASANGKEASKLLVEIRAQRWYDAVDTSKSIFTSCINALVTDGVMTAQQRTDVNALRAVPASRAENLWGVGAVVTPDLVGAALSPDFAG
jgi:hypothetical protein